MANYGRQGSPMRPQVVAGPDETGLTPTMDYWNTPVFQGMPLSRFVTAAGLFANALAPNSFGGRLGRSLAGMAAPVESLNLQRESLLDFAKRRSQAEAAQAQEKQRRLGGLLEGLQPQRGGYRVFGAESAPGTYGPNRVGTSLEGADLPDVYPQASSQTIADIYSLLPKEGAEALMGHLRNMRQLPSEADASTRRALEAAQNPELQGLIPPGARSKYTYGKEGLGFSYEQPPETAPKQEYKTGYEQDPSTGEWYRTEYVTGAPGARRVYKLSPRDVQREIQPERKYHNVGEAQSLIQEPNPNEPGGVVYTGPLMRPQGFGPNTYVKVPGGGDFMTPPAPPERGLRNVNPGDYVVDERGNIIFQAPQGAAKPEPMSDFDTQVRAQAQAYRDTMTPEEAAADVKAGQFDPAMYKFKQAAYYEAYGSPQANERTRTFWNRRQQIEEGARQGKGVGGISSKPQVYVNPKTGERIIKRNGQWVPYDGD